MSLSDFKVYSFEKKRWTRRKNMTRKFSGARYEVYTWCSKSGAKPICIRRGNDERAYWAGFAPANEEAWKLLTEDQIEKVFEEITKKEENQK